MIDHKKAAATGSRKTWGKVDGRDIFLFTLVNGNGMELRVTNYGAAVQSIYVPDKNNHAVDVVLGYDGQQSYLDDSFYMGTLVGRCANRISGSKVTIGEDSFNLHIKEGGYHHHGGQRGFNHRVWEVNDVMDNSVSFKYFSTDGEEGYPGNLETIVTYSLDENNCWSIVIQAQTDKTTLFNPTHHAYFNLEGHSSNNINNHLLQINTGFYLPVNPMQVPSGTVEDVANGPFDFRALKPIGRDINEANEQLKISNGYDHSWVLEDQHTSRLKHAATVYAPSTGIQMNVFTTEPAIHFYSGNFLDIPSAKEGFSYAPRSGFCLETQHFPDAPNQPHFPSIVLSPEQTFFSKTIYQFSIMHSL